MSSSIEPAVAGSASSPHAASINPPPWLVAVPALIFLVAAGVLLTNRVWPFVNFFYIAAWYPTILILDAVQAARSGKYYVISRPRFTLSLLLWSAVLWFFFELVNIRLANWYYVNLPPDRLVRWIGTAVSFATVFPAIFLAERLLTGRGLYEKLRSPTFAVTRSGLIVLALGGVLFAVLSMVWPRAFFPMVWGALTLLLEPWNYSRDPDRSLLGDLSRGRPARLLRFLTGGLFIGFLWEFYNIESRSKWIYTVPGFENFKLFEMPLLGFFGFPVFALDCFVVYQTLVLLRVAVPEDEKDEPLYKSRPGRTLAAVVGAIAFSVAVLFGMDRWNTDSLRPDLGGMWLASPAQIDRLANTPYVDLFMLAGADPEAVAAATDARVEDARGWVNAAQLIILRGIGIDNARLLWESGITSVGALAAADQDALARQLQARSARPRVATAPKVRVWVSSAQRYEAGQYVPASD